MAFEPKKKQVLGPGHVKKEAHITTANVIEHYTPRERPRPNYVFMFV